jgi:hypothetical protein
VLGLSPQRVQQLTDGGQLAAVRTPLGRLIDRRAVEQLAERRATSQAGHE